MAGYLGLDLGTQGLKAVIIDDAGAIRWRSETADYPTTYGQVGWAEQRPDDWLRALDRIFSAVAAQVLTGEVKAVGVTGQMHSLVVCDEGGQPLRSAILWSDTRAAAYGQSLEQEFGRSTLLRMTGNVPLSNFSLLRLLWIRDHEPSIYPRIARTAVAKDWLRAYLTGTWGSDVTDASGTYAFDVARRTWSEELLGQLGLTAAWWGSVHESSTVVGELRVGPPSLRGVPVIAGAGDQEASAVGTGLRPGLDLGLSIGTSGVVFWPLTQWKLPPQASIHAFCHAVPDTWHWMGVTQSAALSVRWIRQIMGENWSYAAIDEVAASAPPGSGGIRFLPFLQGERTPLMNPDARGAFLGLDYSHGPAHLVRAVLEGVAFSLRQTWDTMNGGGDVNPERIVVTGGGTMSRFWMQIMADVFARPLVVVDEVGAAVGAARLAAPDPDVNTTPRAIVEPSRDLSVYQEVYGDYCRVVSALEASVFRQSGT